MEIRIRAMASSDRERVSRIYFEGKRQHNLFGQCFLMKNSNLKAKEEHL